MINKQIRAGTFQFTVALVENQKRASPTTLKAQLIFHCSLMLACDFFEMYFSGSLSALQLSAFFLAKVSVPLGRHRGANMHLQSTRLPKSPSLSISF